MRSKAYRVCCIECQQLRSDVGRDRGDGVLILSASGLCPACSVKRMMMQQNADTVRNPEWLRKWREGTARAAGAIIPLKPKPDESEE